MLIRYWLALKSWKLNIIDENSSIFFLFVWNLSFIYLFFNQMTAPMDEDELCDTK